jgi:hypothetical protein
MNIPVPVYLLIYFSTKKETTYFKNKDMEENNFSKKEDFVRSKRCFKGP